MNPSPPFPSANTPWNLSTGSGSGSLAKPQTTKWFCDCGYFPWPLQVYAGVPWLWQCVCDLWPLLLPQCPTACLLQEGLGGLLCSHGSPPQARTGGEGVWEHNEGYVIRIWLLSPEFSAWSYRKLFWSSLDLLSPSAPGCGPQERQHFRSVCGSVHTHKCCTRQGKTLQRETG